MEHLTKFYFLLSFLWSQIFLQKPNCCLTTKFQHLSNAFLTSERPILWWFLCGRSALAPAWCWYHCSVHRAMTVIKTSVFSPEHSRLLCGRQQGKETLQEWLFGALIVVSEDLAWGLYWQKKKLNTINWRMSCIFTSCSLLVTENFMLKFCCYQITELNSSFLQKVFQLQICFPLQ